MSDSTAMTWFFSSVFVSLNATVCDVRVLVVLDILMRRDRFQAIEVGAVSAILRISVRARLLSFAAVGPRSKSHDLLDHVHCVGRNGEVSESGRQS